MAGAGVLWCWRHPKARDAAGRCIGRTDLAVDPRKAKRLAHRIRRSARQHGLRREVWVSTLRRAADVGAWLRRWGWVLHVDARLCEMDFGTWEGRRWADIAWAEVEAWQADLLHHAPGGGETLAQVAQRVQAFRADACADSGAHAAAGAAPRLLVTHGGWLNAGLHVLAGCSRIDPATWPAAPRHGSLSRLACAP